MISKNATVMANYWDTEGSLLLAKGDCGIVDSSMGCGNGEKCEVQQFIHLNSIQYQHV